MRNIYPFAKRTAEMNNIEIFNSNDDDEHNNDGDKMLGNICNYFQFFLINNIIIKQKCEIVFNCSYLIDLYNSFV